MIAVLSGVAVTVYRYRTTWTALQRVYLPAYLRSQFLAGLGMTSGRYQLLHVVDPRSERLALNEDVRAAVTSSGDASVALSDLARHTGARQVIWRSGHYRHASLQRFLRTAVYHDQGLIDLARPALWGSLSVLLVGLAIALPRDLARARARRHGQRLKGPELVSIRRFNRRLRAEGVGFVQAAGFVARLLGWRSCVCIPRALEASHLLIMGDSGTGKSSLIRQVLQQLDARGDTAIVYDPALEYTSQFYRPERGDLILNPLDARSPYWSPGDELRHEAEALTLATSLFPDRQNENPFFTETPRRIFAHLLTFRPTAHALASWLCQGDELDQRVHRTPYATMIDPQAPAQRSGVLASLNLVADTLKLIPPEHETPGRWSALTWAQAREGWLFLTSTPETRTRLVPLTSLWLDMLVLRLMNFGQPPGRPVWFVLDELATLQRLPQLHTAVTENRKSNNPVILGFQGRSQLETRYGHDAEAMLSQPATKIFLRTSEPRAAKWISDTIGEIEVERLRESRSSGSGSQQSYGLERHVEPLVMASEISGLGALRGFLKVENLVVRLHVPFVDLPARHSAFEPRSVPASPPGPHTIDAHEDASQGVAPATVSQTQGSPRTSASQTLDRFFQ